jgi:hypothetical protein
MDEEDEEDEDAMDEKQRTGPMTAREMEEAVEATLNVLFGRVGDVHIVHGQSGRQRAAAAPAALTSTRAWQNRRHALPRCHTMPSPSYAMGISGTGIRFGCGAGGPNR